MIKNVHIELTSGCNLECKMCYTCKLGDEMPYEKYMEAIKELNVLDQTGEIKISNVEIGGHGEPLLYKSIVDALKIAKKYFDRVSLITNGTLLNSRLSQQILETDIDHIEISITGIKKEVYSVFQGYNNHDTMDLVIKNIKELLRIRKNTKKKTIVSLSYISSDESKVHLKDYLQFWRETGVDRVYVHPLISDAHHRFKSYKSCYMIGQSLFLHSNGDVKMCCHDFKRELIIGNSFRNSIKDIIKSELFTKIELCNNLMKYSKMPLSCRMCTNLQRYDICSILKRRRKIIYFSWQSKVKGFIWEAGILLYEILPPNRYIYKILYYLKAKLNVF
ncbi:MAG: radical SAM protein [Clostridiales bacterium]|nr:radical SAM protein [Clostridiales bacterium]